MKFRNDPRIAECFVKDFDHEDRLTFLQSFMRFVKVKTKLYLLRKTKLNSNKFYCTKFLLCNSS